MDEFEQHSTQGFSSKFWKPEPGHKLFGSVVDMSTTKYGRKTWVVNTNTGKVSTPTHTSLINLLEKIRVEAGDQVLITCTGWSERGYGPRNEKILLYEVAVRAPDGSWKEITGGDSQPADDEPAPEPPPAPKPVPAEAPKPAPVEAPKPKPAPKPAPVEAPKSIPTKEPEPVKEQEPAETPKPKAKESPKKVPEMGEPTQTEEVRHFVSQLFKFFKDMKTDEFNRYINETRKFNLTVEEAVKICADLTGVDGKKFDIVIDGDKVVKSPK